MNSLNWLDLHQEPPLAVVGKCDHFTATSLSLEMIGVMSPLLSLVHISKPLMYIFAKSIKLVLF